MASTVYDPEICVDDGLTSRPTAKEAIDLLTDILTDAGHCNLRLHNVVSNTVEVMEAFQTKDRSPP